MYVTDQRLNDIYRNCDEVVSYLESVGKGIEIANNIIFILERLHNIKETASFIGISVGEKDNRIKILEEGISQLEFEFEDLD